MPNTPLKLLEVVALLVDKPAERLVAGQVGTVGELLSPDVYEVEVSRLEGTHDRGDGIEARRIIAASTRTDDGSLRPTR